MGELSYTNEDLKTMQSWPLERKIRVTQTRIIEWYQHYEGKVYVSFSGGKDSTVLLDLARRVYPDIEAVFINTGLEYPEIVQFTKSKDNVTMLRPDINFKQVMKKHGYPVISKEVSECVSQAKKSAATGKYTYRMQRLNGELKNKKDGKLSQYNIPQWKFLLDAPFEISHKCCNVMKKDPAHKFEKKTGKHPVLGTMTQESRLRLTNWKRFGCNGFDMKKPTSTPISFWTEQDVLHYLRDFNIDYCSVYGDIVAKNQFLGQISLNEKVDVLETTGCDRTGCMFCMFGVHLEKEPNRFQRMKITHPKHYDYCMRSTEDGGLGLAEVLDYIRVPY